uniref:EOG090X09Q6 n=1 Tax=Moina brachiata TaxID=675436 RepID=A0A4Y7NIS6_9CRUS|nr:EOG090X09Q6 [Moina brachiata]SVE93128.1 EOG090X09Q6 [Moina brachiata]
MADGEAQQASVCTFTFKKRRGPAAMRRKAEDDVNNSSEDETVVTRAEKKGTGSVLSAKTNRSTKKAREQLHDSSDEDGKEAVTVSFTADRTADLKRDDLATSTNQVDTELDRDARAIFEKSQQIQQELKGKADDKIYRGMANYAQYYEKRDTAQGNAASAAVRRGPIRASANIRATVRWDYQPDICKDYKETGFCGFGDSCKFLHDRSDYKFGWQLEREERKKGPMDEEDDKYEIHSDEEDMPFKCFICRDSFKNPIVTKCKHYFCEACALKQYKKSQRCYVCGKQTFGVFNPAKQLMEKLKLEEEGRKPKPQESDSEEEFQIEIPQSKADDEEPVTEIEHIHYDDENKEATNETDSDDDSD